MKKAALNARSASDPAFYAKKRAASKAAGRDLTTAEFLADHYEAPSGTGISGADGVSVFDPVVAELVYRWWCPPGGVVLDPFAGGSVRGVVASRLGRRYVGVDLRPEQVAANVDQAAALCSDPLPVWVAGDSRELPEVLAGAGSPVPAAGADLVFTCPPYGDLEVYSDDARDLSRASWEEFAAALRLVVARSVALLAENRFAVFVVGDLRDKRGFYRGLPELTVAAFAEAGVGKYNEAVLVTPLGSLPVIVGRQFVKGRKLGKCHQNVLVFCKGDPRRAVAACGEVDVSTDPLDAYGEPVALGGSG